LSLSGAKWQLDGREAAGVTALCRACGRPGMAAACRRANEAISAVCIPPLCVAGCWRSQLVTCGRVAWPLCFFREGYRGALVSGSLQSAGHNVARETRELCCRRRKSLPRRSSRSQILKPGEERQADPAHGPAPVAPHGPTVPDGSDPGQAPEARAAARGPDCCRGGPGSRRHRSNGSNP